MLMAAVWGVELDIVVRLWIEDVQSEVFDGQQSSSLKAEEFNEVRERCPDFGPYIKLSLFPCRYGV